MEIIIIGLIQGCIFGAIADSVAKSKNQKGFWWGFWLSWVGLIVVACMPDNRINSTNIKDDYASKSKYEKLEHLQKLKEAKAITTEEFELEKKKILNQ